MNRQPGSGVNITVRGKKGVQTDKDGNFSISITTTGTVNLEASSVGFEIEFRCLGRRRGND